MFLPGILTRIYSSVKTSSKIKLVSKSGPTGSNINLFSIFSGIFEASIIMQAIGFATLPITKAKFGSVSH